MFLKLLKTSPTLIFSASNFGEINYNDQIIKNILDNPDQFNQDFKDGKIGAIDILKINTSFLNNNKEILNEIYDSYDGYLNNKENLLDFLNIVSNDFYNGDTETFYKNVNQILGYDSVIDNNSLYVSCWFPEQIKIEKVFEITKNLDTEKYNYSLVLDNTPQKVIPKKQMDIDL